MKITILGDPIPKARHRSGIRKGKIISYDIQSKEKFYTQAYLSRTVNPYREQNAVIKDVVCYVPIPASYSDARRNRCLWGIDRPVSKPDVDNYAKFYMDCSNEIIYKDDCQVIDLHSRKRYSANPRVEMIVTDVTCADRQSAEILSMLSPAQAQTLGMCTNVLLGILSRSSAESVFDSQELPYERIAEAACLLSELAEVYGPILQKIKKKHPEYYKKVKQNQPEPDDAA